MLKYRNWTWWTLAQSAPKPRYRHPAHQPWDDNRTLSWYHSSVLPGTHCQTDCGQTDQSLWLRPCELRLRRHSAQESSDIFWEAQACWHNWDLWEGSDGPVQGVGGHSQYWSPTVQEQPSHWWVDMFCSCPLLLFHFVASFSDSHTFISASWRCVPLLPLPSLTEEVWVPGS